MNQDITEKFINTFLGGYEKSYDKLFDEHLIGY